jgi:hypothetical protein
MEQTKFKLIVDTLLTPQVKERILKVRKYTNKEDQNLLESSFKLAPTVREHCNDCDKEVVNRRVEFYINGIGTKRQQWNKHCLTCRTKTKISKRDILK